MSTDSNNNSTKVKSVFLGKVIKKVYSFNNRRYSIDGEYYGTPCIEEKTETIRREKVTELELERPPYEVKQEIYLAELDKYANIEKVTRSTDGSIVYNITYVIKTEDEEESKKQRAELQPLLEQELVKFRKYDEENKKKCKEKSEKEEKEKAEYAEYIKQRNKNIKNVKGVFIQKIDVNERGGFVLDNKIITGYKEELINNVPDDYIVLTTPMDVQYFNMNNQKEGILGKIKKLFKK